MSRFHLPLAWHSLRTRITVGVLLAVISTLWVATFIINQSLQRDMEETLSDQQFSVVSLLANEVDRAVRERVQALESVASQLEGTGQIDFASLKRKLESRPVFLGLFNWGVILTDASGRSLISLPLEYERSGVNYADVPVVRETLAAGRTVVGDALVGPTTKVPMVPIATPIRNGRGEVTGLLIGLTNLLKPNFLDTISANRFGKQGGYLITEPRSRTFIAATDKTRVMRPGPPRGVNPIYDSYIDGNEGSGVAMSSRGVVELSSSKRIPSTGWLMQSVLPAEEAFAPITRIQHRLVVTSLLLSLLAGLSAWWWLRLQLAPLKEAASLLEAMREDGVARQPLPVRNEDEIGQLAGAFNGLLQTIEEQKAREAENAVNARLRKIVSSVPGVVFQYRVRPDGSASLPFASDAMAEIYGIPAEQVGEDTAQLREVLHPDDRAAFIASIEASARDLTPWICEYRIRPPSGERWLRVNALPEREPDGTTLWHGFVTDITRRKEAEGELRLAAATFETQQAIFVTDEDFRILRVNRAFSAITGYVATEVLGKKPDFLRPSRQAPAFHDTILPSLSATGSWQGEVWSSHRDGTPCAIWITVSPVRNAAGRVTHYVTAFSDITERRQAEDRLRRNKDMMQAILNAIQESIFLLDPEDRVIAINPTAARRMNREPKELIGKDLFEFFPTGLAEERRRLTHAVVQSGKPAVHEDERGNMAFSNSFYPLLGKDGKPEAVVVVATDITARKRMERDLENQARTDPLTGLLNRRHFMALAEAELTRTMRYGTHLSAIMLDIDHFKTINDSRGHRTGDLVLQNLATLARKTLRDVDVIGRLGGEEFAVLLPETGGEQAMEVAERLRHALEEASVMPDAGLPVHYTASIGVASVDDGAHVNVDTLLNAADQALYAAKNAGRNRVARESRGMRPARLA